MNTFIGVDLGWYGKPTGLASLTLHSSVLSMGKIARLEPTIEILDWIEAETGQGSAVVAIDAPLIIQNQIGIRPAERGLSQHFRRFHAGCHPANLGRPFATNVIKFSRQLEELGFRHGAMMHPRQQGRFQIEVHPHAATVNLFGLERIVKYKRGSRAERAGGLRRLRKLMLTRLPQMVPPLIAKLPHVPTVGDTKPVEDQIDAILCAFIAGNWWWWTTQRNQVYGNEETGYIVVPHATGAQRVVPFPARRNQERSAATRPGRGYAAPDSPHSQAVANPQKGS